MAARRLTAAEKGKGHDPSEVDPPPKRIRAPAFDTSELIRDNALTLIGRVTNPREQPVGSLISALPRKWVLKGHTTGSNLGRDCFQFRFELEEDLTYILRNRPYNYNNWMLILQRWKPVISPHFPSQIPFWIRLQGLLLHLWHEKMIYNIGQDLGTIEDYKITKTAARIQVSIDGLKPLTKTVVVDFDSGEELVINLDYEDLGYHCSISHALSHVARTCPLCTMGPTSHSLPVPPIDKNWSSSSAQETQYPYKDRYTSFSSRLDRYGRPFGERLPPPALRGKPLSNKITPSARPSDKSPAHYRRPRVENNRLSREPPHRTPSSQVSSRARLATHHSMPQQQWRVIQRTPSPPAQTTSEARNAPLRPPLERNLAISDFPHNTNVPSTEVVMNELQELTYQYVNVADPTEAAARRQRVIQSESEGLMETTAARIIANATNNNLQDGRLISLLQPTDHLLINPTSDLQAPDRVLSTPTSTRRLRHREGSARRTPGTSRIFPGTNLRKRNIGSSTQSAVKHGFPHTSPIRTDQAAMRRGSVGTDTSSNRTGRSADFPTHPPPLP